MIVAGIPTRSEAMTRAADLRRAGFRVLSIRNTLAAGAVGGWTIEAREKPRHPQHQEQSPVLKTLRFFALDRYSIIDLAGLAYWSNCLDQGRWTAAAVGLTITVIASTAAQGLLKRLEAHRG
jgi:hypothetical protein